MSSLPLLHHTCYHWPPLLFIAFHNHLYLSLLFSSILTANATSKSSASDIVMIGAQPASSCPLHPVTTAPLPPLCQLQ